jgi:acyl-CoA thioester hydrolase
MSGGQVSALATGGRVVPRAWIDYNGHMMDAYYSVAFTEATEAFLDHLGLGAAYRTESGCGMYTVESHVCFAKSVLAGTALRYESQLLGWDEKRLHLFHQMAEAGSGDQVATNELMLLHVDLATERVMPMPPARSHAVQLVATAQAALPAPQNAGRRIHIPGR